MKFNEQRPGIVHRIDKETSGLLVIAKNDFAHEKLSVQFKDKTAHRVYKAVAWGKFLKPTGDIETTIARHPTHRKKFASLNSAVRFYQPSQSNATVKGSDVVDHKEDSAVGKWAFTSYKVLKQTSFFSYVELKLKTGRTHQIRVHLSELGHPLVGDHTYGADKKNKSANDKVQGQIKAADRFFLHAEQLGFLHPRTGKEMMFVADWPEKEKALLTDWGLL